MSEYTETDWTGQTEAHQKLEKGVADAHKEIETKADKTALDSKADVSALEAFASKLYVDNGLSKKADLAYVDAELAKKANVGSGGTTTTTASTLLDVSKQFNGNVKAAVAEAERSGGPSPLVWMGGHEYVFNETVYITKDIAVKGAGRMTRLRHGGTFDGPLFQVNQAKRNGQWEGSSGSQPITTFDPNVDDGGLELCDFSIIDNDRSRGNRRGMYLMSVDDMWMSNVTFGMLTGTALKLGADEADKGITSPASGRVRECNFDRINIYRCGSGSPTGTPDIPALIIQSSTGEGDGSNQLFWDHLRFVYNEGRILISGRNSSNTLRRVMFRDTQLHALADNPNWKPSKWFPFDMVTMEGAVREIFFDGVFFNGTAAGKAVFVSKGHPSTSQTPKRLVLDNLNCVNTPGDIVRVEALDSVSVEGTSLGSAARIVNNVAGSGLARYYIHEKGINSPAGKSSGLPAGGGSAWYSGVQVTP